MTGVRATTAIRYALSRDVLLLVGAAVIGAGLTATGVSLNAEVHTTSIIVGVAQRLTGAALGLAGIGLQIGGAIGLLYKIVADAVR